MMEAIIVELKKHYNFTGDGDLQWFLGIKIVRDRCKGYAVLTQRVHLK